MQTNFAGSLSTRASSTEFEASSSTTQEHVDLPSSTFNLILRWIFALKCFVYKLSSTDICSSTFQSSSTFHRPFPCQNNTWLWSLACSWNLTFDPTSRVMLIGWNQEHAIIESISNCHTVYNSRLCLADLSSFSLFYCGFNKKTKQLWWSMCPRRHY